LLDPGAFNLGALTLAIAVDYALPMFEWDVCEGRPALAAWMKAMRERSSLVQSAPR
jgi:hypothetical protein